MRKIEERIRRRPVGVARAMAIVAGAVLLGSVVAGCGSSDTSTPLVEGGELPQGDRLDGMDPTLILQSSMCRDATPGASPLRRLTNREYRNTLVDLGLSAERVDDLLALLPSEPESLGFRNGATTLSVNTLMAQQYMAIAKGLAGELSTDCDTASDDSACADEVIEGLGLLMHRRPVTESESEAYRAIFDQSLENDSREVALSWVVRAMLQSPHFLYRVEIPGDEVAPVTGYEMASRLSYTFWQAPPDAELLRAAEAGELETPEQALQQARRLLADERAFRVYEFFEQWLDLDQLSEVARDPALYPDLNPKLAALLRAESQSFIQSLLLDPESTFGDLLGAKYTFVNQELAEHYRMDPVEGPQFQRVSAEGRSGVLTQGMLAVVDADTHTSIVRRGLKIRTDFLCQIVPAPPDNVDLTLDGIGADLTQAERLAVHREQPSCNGCHERMDSIGTVFEGFDAVGRERTVDEHGSPVVIEGELTDTIDADGPLTGVDDLASRLSSSVEAEQCYMIQNFRFFFGRDAGRQDLCSQAQLTQIFQDGDQSLVDLLVGIAQSDAFLYKAARVDAPPTGAETEEGAQ